MQPALPSRSGCRADPRPGRRLHEIAHLGDAHERLVPCAEDDRDTHPDPIERETTFDTRGRLWVLAENAADLVEALARYGFADALSESQLLVARKD